MVNKAVLCGINNYQSQTDLRGCVNDVASMQQLLTQVFGFAAAQVHTLLDQQVTKKAIQTEWKWLLEGAKPGDQLVFHFSGHGSYVPDQDGDETGAQAGNGAQEDRYDEITCLYDMDFYNPDTFLRDDEWYTMTQQVPQGVQLTMILDNCHSGTGTRMVPINRQGQRQILAVDVATSSQRNAERVGRSLTASPSAPLQTLETSAATLNLLNQTEYHSLIADEDIVLPRFLTPPPDLQERLVTAARTTGLKPQTPRTIHYLLLTACRDSQTAADAYIDGDFHGAFTYYLCQALRQSPQLGSRSLISTVAQTLRAHHFAQEPQHEGDPRSGTIFGKSAPVAPVAPTPNGVAPTLPPPPVKITKDLDTETQRLLIEAYLKLLDTIAGSAESRPAIRQTSNRYLVYVHGISQHQRGYSDSWWAALKRYLGPTLGAGTLDDTRREVLWSDLVNSRAVVEDAKANAQKEQLRREITAVLEERRRQTIATQTGGGQAARQAVAQERSLERSVGFALDDFLVYMVDSKMRQRIIDRFTTVVRPLLKSNAQIEIIAHSWGTVVAYEGLRELEQDASLQGRVSNFFTVGSALSILPVRAYLRNANKDGRRPARVEHWVNLDAKGDLVGGMVGDLFDVTQEYLDLTPTGCTRGLLGYNLGCAHSSYFSEGNVNVNRDIFAKFILS